MNNGLKRICHFAFALIENDKLIDSLKYPWYDSGVFFIVFPMNTKFLIEKFSNGAVIGLGMAVSILAVSGAYATYTSLTASSNEPLTKDKWNEMLQYTVPPGAVMAFNLSTCPTGWSAADGSSGRPNLRGQFIRGWNPTATGLDANRVFWSSQNATRVFRNNSTNIGYGGGLWDQDHTISADIDWVVESVSWWAYSAATSGQVISSWTVFGVRVRPTNVALLYCVKN